MSMQERRSNLPKSSMTRGAPADPMEMISQLPPISESAEDCINRKASDLDSWGRRRISKSSRSSAASHESSSHSPKPLKFSTDEAIRALYGKGSGGSSYRPSRLFPSIFSCLNRKEEGKAFIPLVESTSALVELSKRQQEALADKQDTIDMLEWQMEQLQALACKEHELDMKGAELSRESSMGCDGSDYCMSPSSSSPRGSPIDKPLVSSTDLLFEMGIVRTTLAIRYFCKVFMKQMEFSGYSVWRAIAEMDPHTTFLRKEHTAFALESRINKALFHCFENESFDDNGLTKILDPANRSMVRMEEYKRMKNVDVGDAINPSHASFEPEFFRFCQCKTREMWALFPWNIVFKSTEERAAFTAAFLDAAKGVWLLHRLAYAMNPVVGIIRVGRGMEANHLYVDPVAVPDAICRRCHSSKVEFMIMPGFRTPGLIKCQVYLHIQCK